MKSIFNVARLGNTISVDAVLLEIGEEGELVKDIFRKIFRKFLNFTQNCGT